MVHNFWNMFLHLSVQFIFQANYLQYIYFNQLWLLKARLVRYVHQQVFDLCKHLPLVWVLLNSQRKTATRVAALWSVLFLSPHMSFLIYACEKLNIKWCSAVDIKSNRELRRESHMLNKPPPSFPHVTSFKTSHHLYCFCMSVILPKTKYWLWEINFLKSTCLTGEWLHGLFPSLSDTALKS